MKEGMKKRDKKVDAVEASFENAQFKRFWIFWKFLREPRSPVKHPMQV